jgi:hypothetical protein
MRLFAHSCHLPGEAVAGTLTPKRFPGVVIETSGEAISVCTAHSYFPRPPQGPQEPDYPSTQCLKHVS